MPELITLTAPIAKPSQTSVVFERLIIDVQQKSVYVSWVGNNGEAASATYPTPAILNPLGQLQSTGAALITTLNQGNFTTTSLVKKTFQKLQADGYLPAGTISGSPD